MIFTYIDPGAGSMLLQALIAGFLGILMFFKNIKIWILSVFKRKSKDTNLTPKD